jgi:site-specific DNA-cytosine methylase
VQLNLNIHRELLVDNFAGGGGASCGIESALGRRVDIAINHDPRAVAMHQANHPETQHYCESVWDIRPAEVTQGRPVGLVWLLAGLQAFQQGKRRQAGRQEHSRPGMGRAALGGHRAAARHHARKCRGVHHLGPAR